MGNPKRGGGKSGPRKTLGGTGKVASQEPAVPVPGFDAASFGMAADQMRAQLAALATQTSLLTNACDSVQKDGALASLAQTDAAARFADTTDNILAQLDPLKSALTQLRASLDEWHSAERDSRRFRFEEGARLRHWTLVGSWPEPVVNGIVFILVDEGKGRTSINNRPLSGFPSAERLLVASHDALSELERNRTEPVAFIATVWKAFLACGGQPGAGVDVFDLLAEMTWRRQSKAFGRDPRTDLFRGYSAPQFRADLTHYLASGAPPAHDGRAEYRLEVVGGSFSQDGLFMYFPQTQRLATCGRLTFRAKAEGE